MYDLINTYHKEISDFIKKGDETLFVFDESFKIIYWNDDNNKFLPGAIHNQGGSLKDIFSTQLLYSLEFLTSKITTSNPLSLPSSVLLDDLVFGKIKIVMELHGGKKLFEVIPVGKAIGFDGDFPHTPLELDEILMHSPYCVQIVSEGKIEFINLKGAATLGAERPEDIIGLDVTRMIHPDYVEISRERMSRVINQKQMAPAAEQKLQRLNGESFLAEIIGLPIEFKGKPAVQVIFKDITLMKSSQGIIKKKERLFKQLFENSPMGIVLLDEKFLVKKVNPGFCRMFDFSEAEILGNKLNDLVVPEGYKEEAAEVNSKTAEGEVCEFETVRLTKTGRTVHVFIYGLPVVLNDNPIGIYGIYVDITKRKIAEQELQTRNLELDNFVYKVSHDLRAPLLSILGLINLTKLEDSTNNIPQYISLMEGRVKNLDRFITDILSHSKNLKTSVEPASINFEELVDECFKELSYLEGSQEIQKRLSISKIEFHSDPWRIREIIRNLISNSIKYQDSRKLESIIDISMTVHQGMVNIIFKDNGIGIPKADISSIYNMFYRANDSTDGSGIGLYIVKNAVKKLGGTISIQSEERVGTEFKIALPDMDMKA